MGKFEAYQEKANAAILFLRGHASPQWLLAVGKRYRIHPELFRRHLNFEAFNSGDRDLYSTPSLPSSSARIFQMKISTICIKDVTVSPYEPEDLQAARHAELEALGKYFKLLPSRAQVADSVVRKCLRFSQREYVLEQTITVEVCQQENAWQAVVWLDGGKDLSESADGPWLPPAGTRPLETHCIPVIVNDVQDLSTSPPSTVGSATKPRPGVESTTGWNAAQNFSMLPFHYGTCGPFDRALARMDALYASGPLFRFAAASEVQFLNLLDKRIQHELSYENGGGRRHKDWDADRQRGVASLNLSYIMQHLSEHAPWLAETVELLEGPDVLDWPPSDDRAAEADCVAQRVLADFRYLVRRAEALAHECEYGMGALANRSVLEESRRSTKNSVPAQKLLIISVPNGLLFVGLIITYLLRFSGYRSVTSLTRVKRASILRLRFLIGNRQSALVIKI